MLERAFGSSQDAPAVESADVSEALVDAAERAQLCDLLIDLGPEAPTVLNPWTTRDLAAHLLLREHDYLPAPGLVFPGPLRGLADKRTRKLASGDYVNLVDRVRSGPPHSFFRTRCVRRVANLNEFFVHHEDVRRANEMEPRSLSTELEAALWRNATWRPWFLARRLRGVGLELEWAGAAKRARARRGTPSVRVVGPPSELLLFLFGRIDVTRVDVEGDPYA
jgi:uncharacterized protein (TIGR03085 family)